MFEGGGWKKPLKIESAKQLADHFDKKSVADLEKIVDFDQQVMLVFAWRGSGQDELSYVVAESYPEQVTFSHQKGRTRDLREHVKIYVLRKNVRWSVR